MNGNRTIARMKALKGIELLSRIARYSPRPNLNTLATIVYRKVLNTDSQKTGSSHSQAKFSRPMNTPSRPIRQSVRLSQMPKPSG